MLDDLDADQLAALAVNRGNGRPPAARERAAVRAGKPPDLGAEWEPPAPFGRLDAAGPPLPIEVFPGWAAEYVGALAESTQTPHDMGAAVVLGSLAAAVGGRVLVEVDATWIEPTNLYVAVGSVPATRKSAVLRHVTRPLRGAERVLVESAMPAVIEARVAAEIALGQAEAARRAASKIDAGEEAVEAAAAAALLAESVTVPVVPRILVDDVTGEAVVSLLAEQGRVASVSGEGGIFSMFSGRYSGGAAWLAPWLAGHAGDTIRVDRQGRSPQFVERPAITICCMVQPVVLADAAAHPMLRGSGLLARFVYVLPASTVGARRNHRDAGPVGAEVQESYDSTLHALVVSLAEWRHPDEVRLTLDADATEVLVSWEDELEPRLADGGDLELPGRSSR